MDPQHATDIARQAIQMTLLLAAPVLIVGLVIGLVVGVLQTLTQMQDQTVMFVSKLVAAILVVGLCLPMLLNRLSEYSRDVIEDIPQTITRQGP